MSKNYIYGGNTSTVADAAGVSGILIRTEDGFDFRVSGEDGTFTDYELHHDDLAVTISEDELASFYSYGDKRVLDHNPAVLGLKKAEE